MVANYHSFFDEFKLSSQYKTEWKRLAAGAYTRQLFSST
jgi:hypothetical protein